MTALLGRVLCWLGAHRWKNTYRPAIVDVSVGNIVDASVNSFDSFEEAKTECVRINAGIFDDEVSAVVVLGRKCQRCQP